MIAKIEVKQTKDRFRKVGGEKLRLGEYYLNKLGVRSNVKEHEEKMRTDWLG